MEEKIKLSVVVLTKNEEKNIKRCLASLLWCDDILIIDDFSADSTLKIIKDFISEDRVKRKKIRVIQRKLSGDFSSQRNFGLKKAYNDLVFFVDSDEVVSDLLAREIQTYITSVDWQDISGFIIRRKDYLFGKWLKYGEVGNLKFLRLGRKSSGSWVGKVHEKWEISGKKKKLKNPILHYPHSSVSEFLQEVNSYTDILSDYYKDQGIKSSFKIIFFVWDF